MKTYLSYSLKVGTALIPTILVNWGFYLTLTFLAIQVFYDIAKDIQKWRTDKK